MEEYLAHWGIKNQRWGFRRFQNEDGTLTPAGKERYRKGNGDPRHTPSEARKAAKAEEAAKKFEENRQKALATGNATEVLKYKNFSTRAELEAAYNRISTERKLIDLSEKELNTGKKRIDNVLDTLDTWRARGEKASTVWNFIAKVHNSFSDEEDYWQQIGQASVREAWEKKQKEQAEKKEAEKKAHMVAVASLNGDVDSADSGKLSKFKGDLSANEIKDFIKKQKINKEIEARRKKLESDTTSKAVNEENKKKKEKEEKYNSAIVSNLLSSGSPQQVLDNKDKFKTPEQFDWALQMAYWREEDKKK